MKSLTDIENHNEAVKAVSILAENCIDTHTISRMLNLNLDIKTVNALYDEHVKKKKHLPNVKSSVQQPPTMVESGNAQTMRQLSQLTTTSLYVLGMLAGKKWWECAGHLAKTLQAQGVECDYLPYIIEKANKGDSTKQVCAELDPSCGA